jgi:hypothetical protein
VRAGERGIPSALTARALAGGPGSVETLSAVAAEADWVQLRPALQTAWLAESSAERRTLGRHLARWDSRATDPLRLQMALDICEAQRDARLREVVTSLARSEVAAVSERAQALLRDWPAK